ncbi:coenzyme-B sulfoethylthiotransferase subunit beta [Methanocella sp. CWC-04]|uniref:Methyl-coenzyme M reductase subunit beta n=1 Tax=Methanooceanicella nereidis TaxID=2052831 RepID=A0AAP2RH95_9EURY|nr:coenzyme-B sulfoethylthiotransferase subunit beta [Methanocella sp. CWC-04]MCD1296200.1 coenzyme-B sulfoethylthiotransferase subunit beta [Methanocella sp. CWC-04]
MPKFKDVIDLYDDKGKLLEKDVPLEAISPLVNPTIKKLIGLTKRSVAVSLEGIEGALKTGKVGGKGRQILGKSLDLSLVKDAEKIAKNVEDKIRVSKGDDTAVKIVGGGKSLLVQCPTARIDAGAEFVAGMTCAGSAVTEALLEMYKVDMFDGPFVKAAVWGLYPQTIDMEGGNVKGILEAPMKDEGLGYALRNILCNHTVAIAKRNAMNAAGLSSIFEQTGVFEMGDAIGPWERYQLLGLAYQGLNANNLVYNLVKENGKNGTVGSVVASTVGKAIDDKVIKVEKTLPSGYKVYTTEDVPLWNAYAAAGLMAATMVNCGAMRAAQAVSSTLLYYNDLIERETGLPGVDFGKVQGTAVGFSFFSHSIYGGGGPGIFNGNHVVTRHSKGFAVPCVSAACALDAGTQMFTVESTSKLIGDVFGEIPEFREPLVYVAKGAAEIKGKV